MAQIDYLSSIQLITIWPIWGISTYRYVIYVLIFVALVIVLQFKKIGCPKKFIYF